MRFFGAQYRNACGSFSTDVVLDGISSLRHLGRRGQVRDVEQRRLDRGALAADAEQLVLADRVQVGGVARDLQLAGDPRRGRVGEIERVQRVGLAERDDVAALAHEAHAVDPLALLAEAGDGPDLDEPRAVLAQHADAARARRVPRCLLGRGHAQVAVVLGERVVVEDEARDGAGRAVDGLRRVGHVEAVDLGPQALGRLAAELERAHVAAARDVQAAGRAVDDLGAGHHAVAVERVHAAVEVDGQDREHVEAGELRRARDGVARARGCA